MRRLEQNMRIGRAVGIGWGTTLGILTMLMLCPMQRLTANAEVVSESETRQTSTEARVIVKPSLAIALDMADNIQVTPKSTGTFGNVVTNLQVSTNSKNGFTVFANTVDGTSLTSTATTDEIKSLEMARTMSEFEADSWGIYVGADVPTEESLYQPVKSEPETIMAAETSTASQSVKVAFGTNVTPNLDAGVYTNQVIISVVANPVTVTLGEIENMQDVTPEICTNSELEKSYTLKDVRDDTEYRVARLKDGKCWMQQDLALTLGSKGVGILTPADSDVVSNWIPKDTNLELTSNEDINGLESWKLETEIGTRWYYQFNTLTAGSGQNVTGVGEDRRAASSICPAGWRLPFGTSDYANLGNKYGVTNTPQGIAILMTEPLNFAMAGDVWAGKLEYDGERGSYATGYRVTYESGNSYTNGLTFRAGDTPYLNYDTGSMRLFMGYTVRCVAK